MKRFWPLLLGVLLFSFFIAYRAYVMPFTHDESSTWLNYRHLDVWSCLSNYACWGTANNHWLNTLLLQWSAGMFGESELALRLPNVLAGVLYLIAAALLSFRYVKTPFLQVAAFLLLVAQIYLLDFFSLARGYGLMSCGVMWAIYAFLRYVEFLNPRWLCVVVLSLVFAILGNFTSLLPWAAIGLGWFVWLLLEKRPALLFRHGVIWFASAVLLLILLRFPIKTLSASGEFEWGSSGPWAMMMDLMNNLLYNSKYFGDHSNRIVLWILILGVAAVVGSVLVRKNVDTKKPIILVFILLVSTFFVLVVQQKLTGAQAPVGRKTIFLIPFIFGLLALGLSRVQHRISGIILGCGISIVLLYHLGRTYPWAACREWYFDAYYPELFSTILPEGASSDSIKVGSSWIFNPALVFYQHTRSFPMSGLVYQKQLVIDSSMLYYYLDPSDTTGMFTKPYHLEKNLGPFLLYKRDSLPALISN